MRFKQYLLRESLPGSLKMLAGFMASNIKNRGMSFNIWEYFIKHAKEYKPVAAEKMKKAKQCYKNAAENAIHKSSVKYIEGYVLVSGVPINHAWNVDGKKAFDCTVNPLGKYIHEYWGIEVPMVVIMMANLHKNWVIADGVLGTIAIMDADELEKVKKHFK